MTLLPTDRETTRTWSKREARLAPPMRAFRVHDVVAEIKPHTPGGITAGVKQLRGRAREIRRTGRDPAAFRFHLVTYRQVDGDPSRYETYVSDPRTMAAVMSGASDKPGFLRMSARPLHVPRATERIAVHQCPTMLGNELEPLVRRRYAAWMRLTQGKEGFRLDPKPSAQQTGADIRHRRQRELVDYLRELAAELEAELPAGRVTSGPPGAAAGPPGR